MKGSMARSGKDRKPSQNALEMSFDDNGFAQELFGFHHSNLVRLEQLLEISIHPRGNEIVVTGDQNTIERARDVLDRLYVRLKQGLEVTKNEVDAAVRMVTEPAGRMEDSQIVVQTRNRSISPRSGSQADYLRTIDKHDLTFAQGPAGTGKTYLAVAKAVELLVNGTVDRIILSRPAVEAGEQLGFLPGDMREKVDPYLRPLYDALYDMLPAEQVSKRLESGEIEVAPLAFMRGRTLSNAFVILDEAQNTTAVQMKMFLTRLGDNARMVITGDLTQVDLPRGIRSGLRDAMETLTKIEGVGFVQFTAADVVRHPLVTRIVEAYDAVEHARRASAPYEKNNAQKGTENE